MLLQKAKTRELKTWSCDSFNRPCDGSAPFANRGVLFGCVMSHDLVRQHQLRALFAQSIEHWHSVLRT